RRLHLARLAAVGDDNYDVAGDDLTGAAVHTFSAVQEIGWRTGAGKERRAVTRHIFRLADASDVQARAVCLGLRNQIGDALEVFERELLAQPGQLFDCNAQEITDGVVVGIVERRRGWRSNRGSASLWG